MPTLEDVRIFHDINDSELKLIEPLIEPCTCHAGQIFQQGDPAIHLYLVIKGTVDITYKPYDTPPITITSVKPGDIFGWSALAGNTVYASGAKCQEKCLAMRIRGLALRTLCAEHPQTGKIILERLASSVSSRFTNARALVQDILIQGVSSP